MLLICALVLSSKKDKVGKAAESRMALQDTTSSQSNCCHEAPSTVAETSEHCSCCQAISTQSACTEVVVNNLLGELILYYFSFSHYLSWLDGASALVLLLSCHEEHLIF